MDRLELWILSVLHLNEADKFRVAMSISEILEMDNDTTRISVYKHLKQASYVHAICLVMKKLLRQKWKQR